MRNIWELSRLVILDGLRRHAIQGLIILAFSLEVASLLLVDFIPKDIGRVCVDSILSIGWFTGFLFLLFHGVQVMAWDEERRTIHTLLARPLSRTQYVLGVFLGVTCLLALLNTALALLGYGLLMYIRDTIKLVYFQNFTLSFYILSWSGVLCIQTLLLSIILLCSGLIRGGFPVLLLTISYYFICTGLPVVRDAYSDQQIPAGKFLEKLFYGMTFVFPDLGRFDFKTLVTAEKQEALTTYLTSDFLLFILYISITLFLASYIYQRRDLR